MIFPDNQDFISLIPIPGDKFRGASFRLTTITEWSQIINKSKNILAFIRVQTQIRKNWIRIRPHGNSDYLLKYFIPEFKETIA